MIDLDEQFFIPTMIKHRQEQEAYSRPHPVSFSYNTSAVMTTQMESSTTAPTSSGTVAATAAQEEVKHIWIIYCGQKLIMNG